MKSAKFIPLLVAFIFCFFALSINGNSQASLFSYENFNNGQGDTLKYRLLFPDYNPKRKLPLVIFLHGSGERGNDNEAQLKWGAPNFATDQNMQLHPAYVIAPQCPKNAGWANITRDTNGKGIMMAKDPTKQMELLIALIQEFSKKFPVDTNRIYITGLSMGGFGTFDAIERYPNLFAAAAPVCGGGDITKAASIKHIPMWIFHGAEDATVDPSLSLSMVDALTKAGAKPGYTQYPEVGHFSWIAAYSDPLFMEWLFRQHK